MAFKGDLTNISLFDVFQTLNQNRQTGVLVLQRESDTKKIHISPDGVRIFFTRTFRPLRLGEIFVRRGLLQPQDVEILLLEQKKEYRPIGQLLVESGKVPQDEVDRILRYHAEDEIFEIFSWEAGTFGFYDGQEPGDTSTPLSEVLMDPASLCLEAARRLDEMERLRHTIPSNEEFFRQTGSGEPDPAQTPPAQRAVFNALAEPLSIDDLRDFVGLSLYDTLTAIHQLVESGLIRTLLSEELVDESFRARDDGDMLRAAQLLELAHRREPANREILELWVETLRRLDEPLRLASALATLGWICLEAGETDEAVEFLEQSLRHDGNHTGALVALRDAFAELGDTERAAETSLKMARAHSELGNLDHAIGACREGAEIAPGAISLRYYLAQLLVRADQQDEARREIYSLIHDTEGSGRARHSEKALDLLASCYRFLLKMDPNDEEAALGLQELERRRSSHKRTRTLVIRGGIAAAVLAIVGVVGLTQQGPDPDEMLAQIIAARQANNPRRMDELIAALSEAHPDSAHSRKALSIKSEYDREVAHAREERRARDEILRKDMNERLDDVREALSDKPYLEAIEIVEPFLDRLQRPEMAFLRNKMVMQIEYALITFMETVIDRLKDDRQQVAAAGGQLQQLAAGREPRPEALRDLENRLARIQRRDWTRIVPELMVRLHEIGQSKLVGKAGTGIEEFSREMNGAEAAFNNLDELFYAVKSERMQADIMVAVAAAQREGRQHLRLCEFEQAQKLYDAALRTANAVLDQEPRKHFLKLLNWMEQRSLRENMKRERDKIERVVASLADIEEYRRKGQADIAYRLLRDLVSEHRLIEFERQYKMPYRVVSTPMGASVYLNETLVGKTPCAIEMDIVKRAHLRIERAGFHDEERRLFPTDESLTGTLEVALNKKLGWSREVGGLIEAKPVIHDGKLLLATNRASLLALGLADGNVAWEAKTRLLDRIKVPPVVAGKQAYLITAEGRLQLVRLSDGALLGENVRLPGKVHYAAAFDGTTLYVGLANLHLLAIRGTTIVYDVPLREPPSTGLLHHDGRIYLGTTKGVILMHDAKTGKEIGKMTAPSGSSFFADLTMHQQLLLAGAEDGRLYAFDAKTGDLRWDYPTSGPINAPAASDGTVIYLPARDGNVHTLRATGRHAISYEVGSAVEHQPALANGFLYAVGGFRIQAFNVVDGLSWWSRTFRDEQAQHVVADSNHIVVITDKPWIYAFEKDVR